jgi:hypothetical protein
MRRHLRTMAAALAVAAAVLALASPAAAIPHEAAAHATMTPSAPWLAELLARLGARLDAWLGVPGLESLQAAGGHAIDPDGTSPTSSGPASGGGGTVTTEGGHLIDPDG